MLITGGLTSFTLAAHNENMYFVFFFTETFVPIRTEFTLPPHQSKTSFHLLMVKCRQM
jgi:hypothetical protein